MVEVVNSYRASDGSLHSNQEDAVSHELVEEVDSWFVEPTFEFKSVARYLQHADKRARFQKILDQFDND